MVKLFSIFCLSVFFISCNSGTETSTNTADTSATPSKEVVSSLSGKELFQRNCTSCHLMDRKLIGPPLKDADKRWTDKQKLYDYIHNPSNYISTANDERINQLHKEYTITMPAFSYLKEAEIDSIFGYIKEQSVSK